MRISDWSSDVCSSDLLPQEPLVFRRARFSLALSLLMPAFSLPHPPQLDHSAASLDAGRSPTQSTKLIAAASAVCLSPATLSAHNHLTSELLRTLSREIGRASCRERVCQYV